MAGIDVAVFDGVGHDLLAGVSTALAMTAIRNARRAGITDLVALAERADAMLAEHDRPGRFGTAALARLDTATGELTYSWPATRRRWCCVAARWSRSSPSRPACRRPSSGVLAGDNLPPCPASSVQARPVGWGALGGACLVRPGPCGLLVGGAGVRVA